LVWNGKQITLILDHVNGVNSDDRVENLRLLCPNCDSQQTETKSGANRGRVTKSHGGFAIRSKDGRIDYTLPAETGIFVLNGGKIDTE
jgi:hypothetical protein